MAHKQFASDGASIAKNNSSVQAQEQRTFITKSYFSNASSQADSSTPNLTTKISQPTFNSYTHNATGFDKGFNTSAANLGQDSTAMPASAASSYQGRTAQLGGQKTEVFASTILTPKQYLGPGAQKVPDGVTVKENVVISRMNDLPNRDLTVDEVRDLINHEAKPNTDAKPEPPSKPLNDPDYKPIPSPAPPPVDEDKSDLIPPPGTMAEPQPPENSEPLPK